MSQWQFVSDDLSTGHIHILELHIYFFTWWYWRLKQSFMHTRRTISHDATLTLSFEIKMHGTPVC